MQPQCILIVDDEKAIRSVIAQVLENQGHRTKAVGSPAEALRACQETTFNLSLLDLKMPGPMDGIGLLEKLSHDYPEMVIIILTGYGTLESAVAALRKGAYDYLTKPIDMQELLASVDRGLEKSRDQLRHRQLIRHLDQTVRQLIDADDRAGGDSQAGETNLPSPTISQSLDRILKASNLILDRQKRLAIQGDKPLDLTSTEYDLLEYLMSHSDRVVTASELLKAVRGYDLTEVDARPIVRVQIQRVRRKLDDDPESSRYLLNVRGRGYRFIG